jgi:hypothetical protein
MIVETAVIATAAKPLVSVLVDKLVTPKIEQFSKWCKDISNELLIPKAEHFQEYLERTYNKYSIINTLVLHNTRLRLKDIYVAQTLVKEDLYKNEEIQTRIDKLPVALIKEYKKILITDTAGMGKSTITRRMFIDLIDNGLEDVGIPIYIELNKLNKERSIIKEIHEELDSLSKRFDGDLLLKLIQTGGFIFFFDGYDEISIADRIEVTKDIQTFISKAGTNNYYILTSRPEDGLTSFGDFQSFRIKALTKTEAFELLSKYDMTSQKELSKKLIDLLKSGEYSSIDEYLENPLLVSLLFAAYDHKHTIPLKKHLFYKQVYEAFFETHDLSKGIDAHQKRSGLFVDDFSRMLKFVGYACLMKVGVKFDKDSILKVIGKAKAYCANLNFKESDFLKDMLTSVPLFCREGNEYKWVHKSLMEYFAARFIADEARVNQNAILTDIFNSEYIEKYMNILDLYYDIDNLGFIKNIERPLLEEYISFHNSINYESSDINKELIEERIGFLYGQRVFLKNIRGIKLNNEILNETLKNIKKEYGINIDSLMISRPGFMMMFSVGPHRRILPIMLRRKKELFKSYDRIKEDLSIEININLSEIKINIGGEDKNVYEQLNMFFRRSSRGLCLDYEKCSNEIKHITNIIKRNENSFLLEGL